MTDKPSFGAVKHIPEDIETAWGARLIWPNDLVWDRQDLKGPDADRLKDWLNDGVLRSVLRMLGDPIFQAKLGLRSDGDGMVVLHEDEIGVVVGDPQKSYGYLYVAAWLKPEVTA